MTCRRLVRGAAVLAVASPPVALLAVAMAIAWAFGEYVGRDAARYLEAPAFPCPFHPPR